MSLKNTATTSKSRPKGSFSLAARILVVQIGLVTIIVLLISAASYVTTRNQAHDFAAKRVLSVAETLANDPFIIGTLQGADPSPALQKHAELIRTTASVDFVTIMDPQGIRYTHPNPGEIGKSYVGSTKEALAGNAHIEDFVGTLGPSVRAVVPIIDAENSIIALISVGLTLENLNIIQLAIVPVILGAGVLALGLGALFAYMLSRYLHRATLGYGPEELRRLYAYYFSALHSLREGLVLIDGKGRLVLHNDQAARLLGLPPAGTLRPMALEKVGLPETIEELFASGRRVTDEIHLTQDRVLVISQQRAMQPDDSIASKGRWPLRRKVVTSSLGAVATLRDHTEVQELTGELESMTTLAEALRAQTHEHANRLHTVATLIELGREREALEFAVADRQESQRLTDEFVQAIDEPYLTSLLVGKAAQSHERGITLTMSASGLLPKGALDAKDLVTITGNLLDNAFDAAAGSELRRVWADFAADEDTVVISIADSGPGLDTDLLEEFFRLGASSKPVVPGSGSRGLGLALVRQAVARLGGSLEVDNDAGAIFTVTLPLQLNRPFAQRR
ncbi:sensor histidine kinase [Arthrobacter sp. MYb227]|uniref:sensor histidine kinase n=1 Tax=Arthrobacter sp. MYb227 TaxID=1848601 RepID=UPI002158990C|nr:sensor histidine kinase [Arthrobacter sp. MYb227]